MDAANIQIVRFICHSNLEEKKSKIHSFTITFGAKYLTGMVTIVPPCETFSLVKKIFFVSLRSTKITSKIQIAEVYWSYDTWFHKYAVHIKGEC